MNARLVALLERVGAVGKLHAVANECIEHYFDIKRHYHNIVYLKSCLAELEEVSDQLDAPDAVELAIWFSCRVLRTSLDEYYDNPFFNAHQFTLIASSIDMSPNLIADVKQLIRQASDKRFHRRIHIEEEMTHDAKYLADICSAIWGRSAQEFDDYCRAVRMEFENLSDEQYTPRRRNFLSTLLNERPIYMTAHFQRKYEGQAETNITRALRISFKKVVGSSVATAPDSQMEQPAP